MTLFVLAYDVRATNHQYQPLYDQLNAWSAAHLQDSVWLADLNRTAADVRNAMMAHMHTNDTVCVIQLPTAPFDWATSYARQTGMDWLEARCP
jgi:CRISPR/Cas system-associated endoribonuclease Cas2